MIHCIATDTELTSIANAIRNITQSSEKLAFPDGFISAISNIGILINEENNSIDIKDLIEGTLSEINDERITSIKGGAFAYCSNLTTVNFPSCSYIGNVAFLDCNNLISANFPVCQGIDADAFYHCSNLTNINFP